MPLLLLPRPETLLLLRQLHRQQLRPGGRETGVEGLRAEQLGSGQPSVLRRRRRLRWIGRAPGKNLTYRDIDTALLGPSLFAQSSLATSESSLDSKCSLEDYLKHRKYPVVNPTCFGSHSIPTAFGVPNGFSRPVPVLKFNSDATDAENPLGGQTSDCVDLADIPDLSAIAAGNNGCHDNENAVQAAEDDRSDSGFPSTSTSRKASVSAASLTKSSSMSQDSLAQLDGFPGDDEPELSTSDVNISLKKSRSLESLLLSYEEEEDNLKDILHSTLAEISRLSASLQSIDSVFSTEEEEEEEGRNRH